MDVLQRGARVTRTVALLFIRNCGPKEATVLAIDGSRREGSIANSSCRRRELFIAYSALV